MKMRGFIVWLAALACLGAGGALGCSGSKPPPKSESDWSSPSDDALDDGDVADPGADEPRAAPEEPDDRPPPTRPEEDYDITQRDCDALAQAYNNAWLNDETVKLADKKLKQKQYDEALAQLHSLADEAREQWYGQCEGIVGTAFLRSRLACAMKAKTLTRFNDCWDGKVEN